MMAVEPSSDPIAEAEALLKAGEHARAIALLQSRLAQGRGGILMRLALGRAQLAAGETADALETLRDVCELAPNLPQAALAMGDALCVANALPAAIAEYERALRLDQGHEAAQLALARTWLDVGEFERAESIVGPLAATSSANAHIAAQIVAKAEAMLSAPRAAPGYVRHLFDQFSANYDERMLVHLSYRAPRILRGLADLMLGALDRPLDILDLGCGTGLSGEAFLDLAGRLDGVDLSPRMIERARERGIYDELSVADLETVLHENGPRYDLLIAADTLVYLGDLEPVLSGAASRLKPGGFFLFTVERDAGEAFSCGPKRRYRHGEAYLRDVAMRSRFDVMGLMDCSPRDEAGVPVEGIAVALQRN